jgi:hypothetical protein
MDEILSYMFLLIKKAKEKEISCKKENFKKHGKTVEYFSGVEQYMEVPSIISLVPEEII